MITRGPAARASTAAHIVALDGWRGLAVLLVFCVHAAGNAAVIALGVNFDNAAFLALPDWPQRLLFWLHRSHHGVFLFFVLSGYLIGRMWWPRPGFSYGAFAWRRSLRVYPAFLIAFAASLLFEWTSGNWIPPDFPRLIGNLFFLNGAPGSPVVPLNTVTWSLFYEMTFYLAFPLFALVALRLTPRQSWWLPVAGVVAPLGAVALGADPLALCWSLLFGGVALAFAGERAMRLAARVPTAVVLAAYLVVTTTALFDVLPPSAAVLVFGAAALALLGKSLVPGSAIAAGLAWAPLVALGRISYSFYLLHWMIVVLVARELETYARTGNAWVFAALLFAGSFFLSCLAATASWWLAERPYFGWVRARVSRT